MLRSLQVRDFALVDDLTLELGPGMTVLTGETGAGKSLLVDALNLALGERARIDVIRHGAGAAEVNAEFVPHDAASLWLAAHELAESDGSCVLRRVVSSDGRSRAFVNARPVPVSKLKALGDLLLDVHGQHAHQSLLGAPAQREALDDFGGHRDELARVRSAYEALAEVEREIAHLADGDDPQTRIDFLRFQISELEPFTGAGRDPASIVEEHRRLAHANDLIETLSRARAMLDDDDTGVDDALGEAVRALESAARFDASVAPGLELLAESRTLVKEAASVISRALDGIDTDPRRLADLERDIGTLHDLARKHRTSIEGLGAHRSSLEQELERLEGAGAALADALERRERAARAYRDAARALSAARTRSAKAFSAAVDQAMGELGLRGASASFELEAKSHDAPSPHGVDQVRLMVSTNPGQPALPLARVASGGELSRIALAVQSVASGGHAVPSLVFDEVDSGIGGAVAEVVGRRMRALADTRQVLAVTHLAQVAAQAHDHVRVTKSVDVRPARTTLERLTGDARVHEIARMLGGVKVTERTVDHAREMLASAGSDGRGRRPAA